ncbi:MAG: hypothetical protein R3F59_27170 [Myxococcota bacterium]
MDILAPPTARTCRCTACGATLVVPDALTMVCVFCDSTLAPVEVPDERIDRVVPFERDRRAALQAMARHRNRRLGALEAYRQGAIRDVVGVLVPLHVFEVTVEASYVAAVRGEQLQGTYGTQSLQRLVPATRGIPQQLADALAPFDLDRALPYTPALVAGYVAERPEVGVAAARERLRAQVERHARADLRHVFLGAVDALEATVDADVQGEHVLLPLWVGVLRGRRGPVHLVVNGQSGRVVSEPFPRSVLKRCGGWRLPRWRSRWRCRSWRW